MVLFALDLLCHLTSSARLGAIGEFLLLDRENLTFDDLDGFGEADAAILVGQARIIGSARHILDRQALVVVDGIVLIVLALVRPPIRGAGGRELEFDDRVAGDVPEFRLRRRMSERGEENRGAGETQDRQEARVGDFARFPSMFHPLSSKLFLRPDRQPPGQTPDRHRFQRPERGDIDDRYVIGLAIGGIERRTVRAEGRVPGTLADKHVIDDIVV